MWRSYAQATVLKVEKAVSANDSTLDFFRREGVDAVDPTESFLAKSKSQTDTTKTGVSKADGDEDDPIATFLGKTGNTSSHSKVPENVTKRKEDSVAADEKHEDPVAAFLGVTGNKKESVPHSDDDNDSLDRELNDLVDDFDVDEDAFSILQG
eukprot:SAG31_NODE_5510_length_2491_cov_1.052676_2_plen_153_part_00